MTRIRIKMGNTTKFQTAFYNFECVECSHIYEKGSPINYVDGEGPYCNDCVSLVGQPAEIDVQR